MSVLRGFEATALLDRMHQARIKWLPEGAYAAQQRIEYSEKSAINELDDAF